MNRGQKFAEFGFVSGIYAFLFVPMFVLIALSFNSAKRGAQWEGFTLEWYTKLFGNSAILDALWTSLEVAVMASALSGLLGLGLGISIFKGKGKASGESLARLTMLPIMLPDVVLGLALLTLFVAVGVPMGEFSIVLGHTAFGAAYVSNLVRARMVALDPLLEDAAADLGAGPWKIFSEVTLPQLWPALLSGMLMVFTLSFDDFIIAFFTAGVGATTLPLKIYSMLKFGVTPEVNALSSLILLVSVALVSIALWTKNKSDRGEL